MEQHIVFKDAMHQKHFEELVSQGEGELLPKQRAFLYLIAMYQEDYRHYEGAPFWVEVYEEVSIDGPVYLLEDGVNLKKYDHERVLIYAKAILRGEDVVENQVEESMQDWVKIAIQLAQIE
ncbi:MAG: hypothetical protein ACRCTE_08850 [Cellulosilyticaceae bacterium]